MTVALDLYHVSINQRRHTIGPASLGWGILGASSMAERHLVNAIRQQPTVSEATGMAGAWVVAVYSHNERRAAHFAQVNQIPHICINLDDLLGRREVQCVYVGSHPRHHFPLTMAALAAGKHVLCETPLALTLEEAQLMEQAATNRGLLLAVNHARRADPALAQMRQLLATLAIGDLLGGRVSNATLLSPQAQTWRLQPNGGGVLFDRTIHSLDLLRFLLADEIAEVTAIQGQRILGGQAAIPAAKAVEEDVLLMARMARRQVTIQVHDSFLIPHHTTSLELYGTVGALHAHNALEARSMGELLLVQNQQVTQVPVAPIDPYWQTVYAFNQAVRFNRPLLASARDGLHSLAATLAVREALTRQVATPLPLLPL